ncbi:MAG: hypothetical protein Q8N96_16040 [Methylovulum sp.]|nr:hypothetical protein [Methylovulum sp.]
MEEGVIGCASQLFDVKRSAKTIDPQNGSERLYAKIGQLNMELEWLIPSVPAGHKGHKKKSPGSAFNPAAGLDQYR